MRTRCTSLSVAILGAVSVVSCVHNECGDAAACYSEALARASSQHSAVSNDIDAWAKDIVPLFERACEQGNADGCRQAMHYWRERSGITADERNDAWTGARRSLQYAGIPRNECIAKFSILHARLVALENNRAKKEEDVDALNSIEAELPGSDAANTAHARVDEKLVTRARLAGSLGDLVELAASRRSARPLIAKSLAEKGYAGVPASTLDGFRSSLTACCSDDMKPTLDAMAEAQDEAAWKQALATGPTIKSLADYRTAYRKGSHVDEAYARESDLAYKAALSASGQKRVYALHAYISEYTKAANLQQAHEEEVKGAERVAIDSDSVGAMFGFFSSYPDADPSAVRAALANLLKRKTREFDPEPYDKFLETFPKSKEAPRVREAKSKVVARLRAEKAAEEAEERREAAARRAEEARQAAASKGGRSAVSTCMNSCIMGGMSCAGRCADSDDECGNRCIDATQRCKALCR